MWLDEVSAPGDGILARNDKVADPIRIPNWRNPVQVERDTGLKRLSLGEVSRRNFVTIEGSAR